ncbi:branched-chain amino acid ABC transporter permease [Amycolatopsis rhabdoformis]|uniref:Branched-chain amino acid ABC transporter permease n=1 Tax=Amycolatopsis rhabdoformis TaxID=1448059 RepID=A0ABZ1IEV9_9PSEU|nr:branched-chain amino acid ABC transporter permease [Amycolatopsis rhabdoformis]WSE32228.1 branched-chain amino acid ABC transporter permease [Amycolatopsis rhabdoformis]
MLTIWSGLAVGAIYVLVAIGFNIMFVASDTFNFAQPQYLMLGTFVSYTIVVSLGLPLVVALVVGGVVGFAVGVLEDWIAIRPLSGTGVHGELVTTVGWSVIMQGCVLLLWGSAPHRVPGAGSDSVLTLLGGRLSVNDVVLIALAVGLSFGTHYWFTHSKLGIAGLAASEDRQAAMIRGINVNRLSTGACAVAGALLGSLGAVVGPKTFAVFTLGSILVLKAFVALAVGGFGSFKGALIGGFAVGVVEALVGRYLGTEFANLAVFGVLIGVLLLRPQGLFGQRRERVV